MMKPVSLLATKLHAAAVAYVGNWQGKAGKSRFCYLINVAQDGLLDGLVLDYLAEDTAISTSDNEDLLGVGVGVHGQVGNHFLVAGKKKTKSVSSSHERCLF
jgi:hypothetical protein